jgi:hypothetical protein
MVLRPLSALDLDDERERGNVLRAITPVKR